MRHLPTLPYHEDFLSAASVALDRYGQYPVLVGIQESVLTENIEHINTRIGSRNLCAVLKGDAYGHNVALIMPQISSLCSHVAVVDNHEAASVRAADQDISLLRLRVGSSEEIAEALKQNWNLRETISSRTKITEVDNLGQHLNKRVDVHISLDVARLGRNGLPVDNEQQLSDTIAYLLSKKNLRLVSIGCHLPNAASSNPQDRSDISRRALERFVYLVRSLLDLFSGADQALPEISAYSSASSVVFGSSGIIEDLGLQCFDRVGNSLFGLASAEKQGEQGTCQVMHVATKVCERVHRGFGSSVGYEHCYTVDRENGEEIALLGIGWLSASLSYQGVGKTPTPAFVINDSGGQHMVLGRQSMNVMTIAAEHVSGRVLSSGDLVYLTTDWGPTDQTPSILVLSRLMGDVQPEFVTASLGGSPSSLRFLFNE